MSPDPLTELTDDDRERLEDVLVEFDLHWTGDRLATAVGQLPSPGPFRLAALRELVKIDLERQARAGRAVPLRDYLDRFPELADTGPAATDLIAAEVAATRETLSAASPSSPVQLPTEFGRYRIVRPLGRGGMGNVYLARDGELDRMVALKVSRFPSDDAGAVERFTREAKAAATIDHPNVCRVYDVGRIDGLPYITMAYIEGPTLADALRDGPLVPRRAAEVARDVARALAEAHRRGVVHRDLKPSNILLQKDEDKTEPGSSIVRDPSSLRPVVTDFGLARRDSPDDPRLTAEGVLAGTPLYMSPEQVVGDRVGPASDVYSLGVVLYEMATGRTPFAGTRANILTQALAADPPPPSDIRRDIDPRLGAIILKALAKRPGERFASMAEFADALDQWLAAPNEGKRSGGRAAARVGLAVGAAALVLLGLAALLVQWTGDRKSNESSLVRSDGNTVAVNPSITPRADATGKTTPETSSSDKESRVIKIPQPPRWKPKLLVEVSLPEVGQRIVAVSFSPDDRQVYTATADASSVGVRQWDVGTGKEVPAKAKRSPATWAVFTADGRRYLAGGGPDTALHWSSSGETVQTYETGPGALAGGVSRDGRRVIVGLSARPADRRAVVYEADSGALVREYARHQRDIQCVALSDDGRWAFSASPDRVAAWEVATGKWHLEADQNVIQCAAFVPKSIQVVAGTVTGALPRYEVADTFKVSSVGQLPDAVNCLALSPNGRVLVAAAANKSLCTINPESRRQMGPADKLPEPVIGMAFSADGTRFVTAGARSWRIWELIE